MTEPEGGVHPTNAFANKLAEHIRAVVDDPRARVVVGARRQPQAVLMATAADVPADIRRILLSGSAAGEAARAADNNIAVTTAAATVIGWLWKTDHDAALAYVVELAETLASRNGWRRPQAARVVLGELPHVLPATMPRKHVDALIEAAAAGLPGRRGTAAGGGHVWSKGDHNRG